MTRRPHPSVLAGAASILAIVAALAACDLPCKSNDDCFGTTPKCNVTKCDCAAHDTCVCTSACASDDDCSAIAFCSDDHVCVLRQNETDPDCSE